MFQLDASTNVWLNGEIVASLQGHTVFMMQVLSEAEQRIVRDLYQGKGQRVDRFIKPGESVRY
jgi:hypothetical protein